MEEDSVVYTAETREEFCALVNTYCIKNAWLTNGKRYVDGKILYNLKTKGETFTVLSNFGVRITCILIKVMGRD